MKPTAVLVNTARGTVVDEAALADGACTPVGCSRPGSTYTSGSPDRPPAAERARARCCCRTSARHPGHAYAHGHDGDVGGRHRVGRWDAAQYRAAVTRSRSRARSPGTSRSIAAATGRGADACVETCADRCTRLAHVPRDPLASALADLVAREVDCCGFFTFTLTVTRCDRARRRRARRGQGAGGRIRRARTRTGSPAVSEFE